jgi:mRNA interferase HigB
VFFASELHFEIYLIIENGMRIITERRLREFWENAKANAEKQRRESAMREWIKVVKYADWANPGDLRQTFNHADFYKNCVIFDVGGNKYRIIAKAAYRRHLVFIRFVLTHSEYDENKWCADCE